MKKRICLSWLHPEALFVQMAKVRNLIETFCVVFYQITAVKLIKLIRSGPSTRPPRKADEPPFITKCSLTHSNYAPERQPSLTGGSSVERCAAFTMAMGTRRSENENAQHPPYEE